MNILAVGDSVLDVAGSVGAAGVFALLVLREVLDFLRRARSDDADKAAGRPPALLTPPSDCSAKVKAELAEVKQHTQAIFNATAGVDFRDQRSIINELAGNHSMMAMTLQQIAKSMERQTTLLETMHEEHHEMRNHVQTLQHDLKFVKQGMQMRTPSG